MTEQVSPKPTGAVGVGPVAATIPVVADDAVMISEIDQDRRHERYLVRAAVVACIVIAIALTIRLVWG